MLCFFVETIFFDVGSFFQQSDVFFKNFWYMPIDMCKRFSKKASKCGKKLPTSKTIVSTKKHINYLIEPRRKKFEPMLSHEGRPPTVQSLLSSDSVHKVDSSEV